MGWDGMRLNRTSGMGCVGMVWYRMRGIGWNG